MAWIRSLGPLTQPGKARGLGTLLRSRAGGVGMLLLVRYPELDRSGDHTAATQSHAALDQIEITPYKNTHY